MCIYPYNDEKPNIAEIHHICPYLLEFESYDACVYWNQMEKFFLFDIQDRLDFFGELCPIISMTHQSKP